MVVVEPDTETVEAASVAVAGVETEATVLKPPPTVVTMTTPKELVIVKTEPAVRDVAASLAEEIDDSVERPAALSVELGCFVSVGAGVFEPEAEGVIVKPMVV